jgi:hypothetical protein
MLFAFAFAIKSFNLITLKPMIYVANVSEEDVLAGGNSYYEKVCEYAKEENSEVVMICAKIESELAELNDLEKAEFLKELGISESDQNYVPDCLIIYPKMEDCCPITTFDNNKPLLLESKHLNSFRKFHKICVPVPKIAR